MASEESSQHAIRILRIRIGGGVSLGGLSVCNIAVYSIAFCNIAVRPAGFGS